MRAPTWRIVGRVPRIGQAKTSMKAGVALVMRAPFAAPARWVPANWATRLMHIPTKPSEAISLRSPLDGNRGAVRRMTIARVIVPRTRRMKTRVTGGITSRTIRLTTYMPPQMDAAPSPDTMPSMEGPRVSADVDMVPVGYGASGWRETPVVTPPRCEGREVGRFRKLTE
ncbi:MAG: hypothetical protein EB107_08355 [Proteobacteria bacterium]|nr:hypothetical protein [Pseudomonadota bacterium]